MDNHDYEGLGLIVGIVLVIAAICFIIYCIIVLATVVAGIAAAGGTLFGGTAAIKNYVLSFKENVIDNKKTAIDCE